ncbi:polysaccharide biosynthesis protein [Patescibacteria group bacterium]|nr:polysaccharide biosynthesis protein [Patescibacteria group bacterium]MBU4461966.1 polysaccharide biosynthesis protein [Patescibacteria group bacterium]MCG2699963.1 polysaccharide biosynthesis protein [Candidatus Parcubacteria bacterium]
MINYLRQNKYFRFGFFVALDIIAITFSIWLSFLIRFDGQIPSQYSIFVPRIIILAIIFLIPIFYFSKLYSFSWSYVSTGELVSLFKAITVAFLFLSITIYISKYFPFFTNFPRSILFVSYFLVFISCGVVRFAKRIYLHQFKPRIGLKSKRTLIVGAGDAGEQIIRSIVSIKDYLYNPVGFIDDSSAKQGILIHGFKVLGRIADIPKIIKQYNIEELIIALPSAGRETIKKAIDLSREEGLKKIRIVPPISEIIDGQVSLRDLREVQVEDLLNREKISLNLKEVEDFIKNRAVLITGAAGSIGSELSRQVAKFKPNILVLLDWDETGIFNISEEIKYKFADLKVKSFIADIKDENKINQIFNTLNPKIVFHAAAYKHVPLMEQQPEEAVKNNIFGTKILAEIALRHGVDKFINISTDKAVNPSSVMGATKRICEMICQTLNQKNSTKFISVRFGNVLNSRGSVIPTFKEQIKRGGPVEVTHPGMKRYFMLISEACLLVMQAGTMGKGGEVFVLNMGEPIKILDLAKEMIRLSGFEPDKDIPIVFIKPRPGEKFFEDILNAEEGTNVTQNEKIFMAKLADINPTDLEEKLKELKSIITDSRREEIIKILQKLIPLYKSKA